MSNKIFVKNWATRQTYRKDRGTPPWIKVHRDVMTNPGWASLSDAEKGQLVSLWIVAADNDGAIPNNPTVLRKICQLDNPPDLQKFIDLDFLTPTCQPDDNQVVTTCPQHDAPETETETETETEKKGKSAREDAPPTPVQKKPSKPPKAKKPQVTLEELSVDHVRGWLAEKRSQGRYVDHDEHHVLEMFKNYCKSKGVTYKDYVAAYQNAFGWERCQPSGKPPGNAPPSAPPNKSQLALEAAMRGVMRGYETKG